MSHFEKVKSYLRELEYDIVHEDPKEELVLVDKPSNGIVNLMIDCEDPILVIEQHIFDIKKDSLEMYKSLLKKNREIVHGAFAIDAEGKRLLFRDTLQLENLDLNELEGTLNSLALLLAEFHEDLLKFAHSN
ncbi:MAG: YbjN domain-containing protein [Flammeovirgaceae bacterium]|nr:YbjN domain-containing protein [Flammeovirgaceae bacterium]MDW8288042.1 molecular chaperone Tir [Flammeovirgaceae bacterium]